MVECCLCRKVFKAITPSHLKRVHGITMKEYRESFPVAPLYSEGRYSSAIDPVKCPTCGGDVFDGRCCNVCDSTPEEMGLCYLRQYGESEELRDDPDEKDNSRGAISWGAETRSRIKRLFQ